MDRYVYTQENVLSDNFRSKRQIKLHSRKISILNDYVTKEDRKTENRNNILIDKK